MHERLGYFLAFYAVLHVVVAADVPEKMTTRAGIVAEARTWMGTPFHHQGYLKSVGCDCIGIVCGVALVLGIEGAKEWEANPLCHQYGRPPNPRFLLEMCDRFLDRVEIGAVRLADILIMSYEKEPMHFALVTKLEPLYVIHALYGLGRVAEHSIDSNWQARVRLCYSFRGVE